MAELLPRGLRNQQDQLEVTARVEGALEEIKKSKRRVTHGLERTRGQMKEMLQEIYEMNTRSAN